MPKLLIIDEIGYLPFGMSFDSSRLRIAHSHTKARSALGTSIIKALAHNSKT
jgi:DNA replication protein DnaC